MRTAQPGDRVQVHYVIRSQDGSVASSRDRTPLELTVGTDHRRLPAPGQVRVHGRRTADDRREGSGHQKTLDGRRPVSLSLGHGGLNAMPKLNHDRSSGSTIGVTALADG